MEETVPPDDQMLPFLNQQSSELLREQGRQLLLLLKQVYGKVHLYVFAF